MLCWDQWYPEAARLAALNGARILIYPTAIGWHPDDSSEVRSRQSEAWELMQRSHGIANGCFVIAVNRVGFELAPGQSAASGCSSPGIGFWGPKFRLRTRRSGAWTCSRRVGRSAGSRT